MIKLTLALLYIFAFDVFAICSDKLIKTTPDGQFEISTNGLIIDNNSRLMWMRCSVGQNWSGNECDGVASRTLWRDAVNFASTINYENHSDWRLPNKNELNSIVETACAFPAINTQIFPQTVSSAYWTSSPYDNETKHIWVIYFTDGTIFAMAGSGAASIRLVRDITQ